MFFPDFPMSLDASAPEPAPYLIERSGPHVGRVHELPYGRHIVGRDPNAAIRLEEEGVSRHHAQLDVSPAGVILRDLGSKNGILVQRERLSGSRQLLHGDAFSICGIDLEIGHPSSMVNRVLVDAGEATVTRLSHASDTAAKPRSVLAPLVGVLAFGALVLYLLFR